MIIQTVCVGELDENCYLISLDETSPVIVIDPGDEGEQIRAAIGERAVAAVLLTHGHFDHTGALDTFRQERIFIHPLDAPMLRDARLSVGAMAGDTAPRPGETDTVAEGDALLLGGLTVEVLHTPGHTPGSVCYRIGDHLFTGDTLFHRGYGRTDFPGGSMRELMHSLRRLHSIPQDLPFHPGHGESATLFEER